MDIHQNKICTMKLNTFFKSFLFAALIIGSSSPVLGQANKSSCQQISPEIARNVVIFANWYLKESKKRQKESKYWKSSVNVLRYWPIGVSGYTEVGGVCSTLRYAFYKKGIRIEKQEYVPMSPNGLSYFDLFSIKKNKHIGRLVIKSSKMDRDAQGRITISFQSKTKKFLFWHF